MHSAATHINKIGDLCESWRSHEKIILGAAVWRSHEGIPAINSELRTCARGSLEFVKTPAFFFLSEGIGILLPDRFVTCTSSWLVQIKVFRNKKEDPSLIQKLE